MARKSVAPLVGEGMIARRLVVRAKDVAFLKGVVEAHEGLAALFAESGGDLTLASPAGREAELDELVRDLASDLGGIVLPAENGEGAPTSASDAGQTSSSGASAPAGSKGT